MKNSKILIKILCGLLVCATLLPSVGCKKKKADEVNLDLTVLSGTMVYSQVYNMMTEPREFIGKKIRMRGSFSVYEDEASGKNYYACVIADATACCSQGLEFVLADKRVYPDEYPALGTEITVSGVFDTYTEGGYQYCQLVDAVIE